MGFLENMGFGKREFNPHDKKYKKVADLQKDKILYKDVPGGFITREANSFDNFAESRAEERVRDSENTLINGERKRLSEEERLKKIETIKAEIIYDEGTRINSAIDGKQKEIDDLKQGDYRAGWDRSGWSELR